MFHLNKVALIILALNLKSSALLERYSKSNRKPYVKMSDSDKFMSRAAIAGGGILAAIFIGGPMFNRFETASDIPGNYFKEQKTVTGKVVKVSDGDTFRVRHTPNMFSSTDYKGKLTEHTIAVRIAAVDTPETAKFGNEGQVFGKASTEFTKSKVLDQKVKVKLYSKDQYGRVIGQVTYKDKMFSKDLSEELLKKGLAVVYRQKGAQYGNEGLQKWEKLESIAKKQRVGIWSKDKVELPSDYKKKVKANTIH
mmetsp:Transcript_20225/g.20333  ORF Transcript_20225/g.20333 Transcript_20225/m.20333 type:complete len:252 (+) Transcript_20225:46-801(+)